MPCCPRPRKRCRKRRRRRSCCKGGRLARSAFIIFLRCFRMKHCKWTPRKVAVEGARCWCKMDKRQKMRYFKMAKKKSGCLGPIEVPPTCCRKRRRRCPPRRKPCPCPRKRRQRCPRKPRCPRRRRRRPCPCPGEA